MREPTPPRLKLVATIHSYQQGNHIRVFSFNFEIANFQTALEWWMGSMYS